MPFNEETLEWEENGEPVPEEEVLERLNQFRQDQIERLPELDENSSEDEILATAGLIWLLTRQTYLAGAVVGAGGADRVDWEMLGDDMVNVYNEHYVPFRNGILALSLADILRRGTQYITNALAGYHIGYQNRFGLRLPYYPKDGTTICNIGCKCHWRIEQVTNGFDCFWILGQAEHCTTCRTRAAAYNPLTYRNGQFTNFVAIQAT